MSAQLIDGKSIRAKIMQEIEHELAQLKPVLGGAPGLAVIRVGDDPASVAYIRQKKLAAQSLGYDYREHLFPASARPVEVARLIGRLNRDAAVHGILLQLPLPPHLDSDPLLAEIDPDKDVDGLHPVNAGRLFQGRHGLKPCTPVGVMRLLEEIGFQPAGQHAVIIGRSNIVGKPMAMLLLAANATAVLCHRHSDVPAAVRQADLVVAAVGSAGCIRGEWIKPGAVVVDVGINRIDGRLIGDVEFEAASRRASFITPVPGGVGAITVAMLMRNTYLAWAGRHLSESAPEALRLPEASPLWEVSSPHSPEPAYGLSDTGFYA
jgi:methylenetetrahydrofolate dehydrogenase (NADP+)/methenyltetrahydrofolate cyclohydrolase